MKNIWPEMGFEPSCSPTQVSVHAQWTLCACSKLSGQPHIVIKHWKHFLKLHLLYKCYKCHNAVQRGLHSQRFEFQHLKQEEFRVSHVHAWSILRHGQFLSVKGLELKPLFVKIRQ